MWLLEERYLKNKEIFNTHGLQTVKMFNISHSECPRPNVIFNLKKSIKHEIRRIVFRGWGIPSVLGMQRKCRSENDGFLFAHVISLIWVFAPGLWNNFKVRNDPKSSRADMTQFMQLLRQMTQGGSQQPDHQDVCGCFSFSALSLTVFLYVWAKWRRKQMLSILPFLSSQHLQHRLKNDS